MNVVDNQTLERINGLFHRLKTGFHYRDEPKEVWLWPDEDFVAGDTFYGDCDDFCTHARFCLDKLGIPNRMLIVKQKKTGFMHGVVEAQGYVLDSNNKSLISLSDAVKYLDLLQSSGFKRGEPWKRILGVKK